MTGNYESGHRGVWEGSEVDGAADPSSTRGAAKSERGPDDDVAEGEIVDDDGGEVTTEIIDGTAPELDELAAALAQRDEFLDSLRRLQAEFENYKKRVAKQQADQVARAALSLVDKVLPVLDTLDLATQHLGDAESADGSALVAVKSQLEDVLAKEGLERIDPLGEVFDPTAHEAVGHLPAEDAATAGESSDASDRGNQATGTDEPVVGQVMRAGYRWRGTVVRPAMVMVRDG